MTNLIVMPWVIFYEKCYIKIYEIPSTNTHRNKGYINIETHVIFLSALNISVYNYLT